MKERLTYFDVLRAIALILVVFIHVSTYFWLGKDTSSVGWEIANFYDVIAHCAVPIFVMIAGAELLKKDSKSISESLKCKIIYSIRITIVWSILYVLPQFFYLLNTNNLTNASLVELFENIVKGHYHLWYMHMIIGLYVIVPILRAITKDLVITKFYIALAFVFSVLVPSIASIFSLTTLKNFFADFHIYIGNGYVLFFLLGYYLSKVSLDGKTIKGIYLVSIASTLLHIFLQTEYNANSSDPVWLPDSIYRFFTTIAIFVFIKTKDLKNKIIENKYIHSVAKNAFGVYLVHAFVLEKMKYNGMFGVFKTNNYLVLVLIPLLVILVIATSILMVSIIKKNKFVKKILF